MRLRPAAVPAAALLVAAFAATADAALCLRKGRVTFRPDGCRKRETQVAGDRVGAVGPAGEAGGPGQTGPRGNPGGVLLFSGDGRLMGRWLHGFRVALVTSPADGGLVLIGSVRAVGVDNRAPDLFHEDEACQGPPLARTTGILVEEGAFWGGVVYHAAAGQGASRTVRSRSGPGDAPCPLPSALPGFCCTKLTVPDTRSLAPLLTFDLSLVGVPPFRLGL